MAKKTTKIDWEDFDKKVAKASISAAEKTDAALAIKLASITSLTTKEIQEIFPEKADVERFSELMKIVKSSTSRNNKVNKIVENSEKFAGILVDLLGKYF
ncbi:hypothetical protein [Mesonia maritima]|uniref:Uncharacterized protein n=1 Tax=Mesonia maritima TaxID=1793873 RepID=A0ABU1K6I6_9FLAO|nr:hypothetical protein [Mesonia maritima]MDR6301218.1 hypothetical protein [Mesonia maritima]